MDVPNHPLRLVLHIVAEDTPPSRMEACAALLTHAGAAPPEAGRHVLVQYGPGRPPDVAPAARLPAGALGGATSYGGRLEHLLEHLRSTGEGRPHEVLLHAWSARAVHWAIGAAARDDRQVLIDAEFPAAGRALARWHTSGAARGQADVSFVCPTAHAQRRMIAQGAPPERTALIRESVDFAALQVDAAAVRAGLSIAPGERLVLALPPHEPGGRMSAWAAMLTEKVRPDVRLVVPGRGADVERLRHLIRSCRHEPMARFPGERWPLPALLRAADAALFLPAGDAPAGALAWAMASGTPMVASATPGAAELLAHGSNAWLAHPNDPRDAAQRLLQALEQPETSRHQAHLARMQAYRVFSRQRMIEQFHRVYRNLARGARPGDGIADPALADARTHPASTRPSAD